MLPADINNPSGQRMLPWPANIKIGIKSAFAEF
jgi:hypothetical protein